MSGPTPPTALMEGQGTNGTLGKIEMVLIPLAEAEAVKEVDVAPGYNYLVNEEAEKYQVGKYIKGRLTTQVIG